MLLDDEEGAWIGLGSGLGLGLGLWLGLGLRLGLGLGLDDEEGPCALSVRAAEVVQLVLVWRVEFGLE